MAHHRVVRPSMKLVWVSYIFAGIVICAAWFGYFTYLSDAPKWLLAVPLIVLLPTVGKHVRQRSVRLTLDGNQLTLESGLLAQTRRTLDMAKVQDVTVRQTLSNRLLRTGDICLETAGETGSIGITGIDHPRAVADEILRASRRATDVPAK
jgi:membrane protein YdbS with pleckstrin-like domain